MTSVDQIVSQLGLKPHPEGGWFRETWRAPGIIETSRGSRNAATAILYLLGADDMSVWHRVVGSHEVWFWQGGGRLALTVGGLETSRLLPPTAADELSPQGCSRP